MSSSDFESAAFRDGAIRFPRYRAVNCRRQGWISRSECAPPVGNIVNSLFWNGVGWLRNRTMFSQIAVPITVTSVITMVALVWLLTRTETDVTHLVLIVTLPALQLLLSFAIVFLAMRDVARSLSQLTDAAAKIAMSNSGVAVQERGARELSEAARAFNAMCARVKGHFEERVQMLSAFAHDMQTPITRMRLRAELSEDFPDREKVLRDLLEMERLVREGITYAKNSLHRVEEEILVDLPAFIESIVFDYEDTGRNVRLSSCAEGTVLLRPMTLRRIISNLVDNSLKYGRDTELRVSRDRNGGVLIAVVDRGPGIEPTLLAAVTQPFVKLSEGSSGIGLGLSIAQQLTEEIGATLRLRNREGGGLAAEIALRQRPADGKA